MGATRNIITKAMKDAAFRQRLLKDAKATLEKELGMQLPKGVTVRVHEDSPTVINLVLPGPVEASTQRSLSEEELQQVSGGVVAKLDVQVPGGGLPTVNPLIDPLNPMQGGLMPLPGGKISAGATFGAYTGCCSSGRRL